MAENSFPTEIERDGHTAAQDRELPTVERWMIAEIAEELASALHHHNIGRDIRGWKEVSEAFDSIKAVLNGRY